VSPCPTIGRAREVSISSFDDRCFELAASWLDDCVRSHVLCGSRNALPLPTRVIDVGLDGSRDPFLWETSGVCGMYAALSYCWGVGGEVLKTTAKNFEEHKSRILYASLPRTLQDAVTIARRLKIPYLWVDALCIIQGDSDDWARESGNMCDVYSFAYLTISASNSPGNAHGIFNTQKFGIPPPQLRYRNIPVYVRKDIAREHNRFGIASRMPSVSDVSQPEPICKRAWTLQEAVLSNRILLYTSEELVWECNEYYRCECGHNSTTIQPDDEFSYRAIRKPESVPGTMTPKEAYRKWNELVMYFSERQLSYEADKLSALSGLAKQVRHVLKSISGVPDVYLAGLWRDDLPESLLWSTDPDFRRHNRDQEIEYRRPRAWRAPSWSWASVEGPVDIPPFRRFESTIRVLDAASTCATAADDTGRVVSSHLLVSGAAVHHFEVHVIEKTAGAEALSWAVTINGKAYQLCKEGVVPLLFLPDDPGSIVECYAEYSCLRIGRIDHFGQLENLFLVLRLSPLIGGAFERVGVSCRSHHWNVSADLDPFSHANEETVTLV
jgi:Heterokaryon incompatibility protein (HET)